MIVCSVTQHFLCRNVSGSIVSGPPKHMPGHNNKLGQEGPLMVTHGYNDIDGAADQRQ